MRKGPLPPAALDRLAGLLQTWTAFLRGLGFAGFALRADPTFIRVEVRRSGNLKWARRSLLE